MKDRILCFIFVSALVLAATSVALADPSVVATLNGPLTADCRWPASVVSDPATNGWLVASTASSAMVRLFPSGEPAACLTLTPAPSWLGLNTSGNRVFALSSEGNVLYQIDPAAGGWSVEASVTTGSNPIGAVQAGAYVYVANAGDCTLTRYSSSQLIPTGQFDLPEEPTCIAFSKWYNLILVGGGETGSVYGISPTSGSVLWSVKTGSMPIAICPGWKLPYAMVVDKLDGTVTPLNLSRSPAVKMAALSVGDCPMAAVQGTSSIVYVTCNTSPSASVWRIDATRMTASKLADLPNGPDPASIALREYDGKLCAVSRCRNGVSLVPLPTVSAPNPVATTIPVSYILRDISGSSVLGQVYAAYSSTVPYPKGTPAGLVTVSDSGSLTPDSTFPTIPPGAVAPWVGGSKLVVAGLDGCMAEYNLPGGSLSAAPVTKAGAPGWTTLCVAESFANQGATAFAADVWGSTPYTFRLPTALMGSSWGSSGYNTWIGYSEADGRLLNVRYGGSYAFSYSTVPGSTSLGGNSTVPGGIGRPSNPGSDSLIYLASGQGVVAISGPFGSNTGPLYRQCTQATIADRNPVAAARNDFTGRVYVANYSDATIGVFDGALNRISTVPVGGRPFRIWCDSASNLVYVGDYDSNIISVIEDVATVPTLSVADAAAAQYGTMAEVTGGIVKTLPLLQDPANTGYGWYYFAIEMPDQSANITVWRKTLPDVQIGQRVDLTGSIQPIRIGNATTKSIVPWQMIVH